ncbi:NAD(P)/FAD-dependent oxidoreductase [Microbacterium sp. zg.B48]|uniref:NAD(P)/FAD-dependent oxidoreductase n=1 Tax=unclassified Microbacterium TaxID=2609290 RepID=UPI00214B823F|nr:MULTISPECIES: FAD/NAD(P)-binding oxidoreductase [unclassified Microbacterium]MCR2764400.1 NAD(P)/FAD-dependent oxidoreductase [Microbacterium sp. zg.B48]MCR2810997.1 NAD(P)/FAD-dependent oxidoreductase [Microbacterium sp. zg.B185]WIM19605.1 FAD/NAD(P)-binding oxidoreductase [Microbacterium sp. zg-B185]
MHSAPRHHQVVVIGGGNAGLSVAGRLRRMGVDDVVVVEPRAHHRYQPLFSHIAGGTAPAAMALRDQADVMPKGVGWIRDAVTAVDAESSSLLLASGTRLGYDHVIVCPGIQRDWDAIPGLAAAMASRSGASNYEFELAAKASPLLRDLRRGTVVFSQPPGPASCAGAAQKPMYLACDYWRRTGVLGNIRVILLVPDESVFGIPEIDAELDRKITEYGIELRTRTQLLDVDAEERTALVGRPDGTGREKLSYDVLMVEPPQSAPDWLKRSTLPSADETRGFVEVDPRTLRHKRYENVWSLGDAAATTNSKSGGALRKQTLTLAKNLAAALKGKPAVAAYEGYSVCPFTVSRSTVVFAEFDDRGELKPTIPFWKGLARERRLTWVLDRHILPWVYWHMILKGRA